MYLQPDARERLDAVSQMLAGRNQALTRHQTPDEIRRALAAAGQPGGDVRRAITAPMSTDAFQDSASTTYTRFNTSEMLSLAVNEVVPLTQRIARREGSRGRLYHFYEQYHDDADEIDVLNEAEDPDMGTALPPTMFVNTMMKQGRGFSITEEARLIAQANGLVAVGTDELGRQLEMKAVDVVRLTEKSILEAQYQDGSGGTRQMRGLLGGFRTGSDNGWIGGVITDTTLDFGAAEITSANIKQVLNTYMLQLYNLHRGPMPNALYVPPRALFLIQEAAFDRVRITMTQSELREMAAMNLGGRVGFIYTDFGGLEIIAHPKLPCGTNGDTAATSRFMFLYEPGISLIDYYGFGGVHLRPQIQANNTSIDGFVFIQYYTMELRYHGSHGVIKNFWIDAA